ncbi:MAG: CBS domain-containing protein [Candidatus Tectimicrobiota bacterium]
MQIRDVMTRSVITAPPSMSLALAQRLMAEHRIRHLPVLQEGQLQGLLSDRDLRQALPSPATLLTPAELTYKLSTIAIAACMTREVVTLPAEAAMLQGARQLLDGLYGCVPVLSAGRLVGILTATDVLRGLLLDLGCTAARLPVRLYMQYAPLTARPEDWLSQVQQRMHSAEVRHVPIVTADGKLAGLLSDRDLRQAGASTLPLLSRYEAPLTLMTMTVRELMRTEVMTVNGESTLADAGQCLLEHKIGCLPVLQQDRTLVGIVTVLDLVRAYVVGQRAGADRAP